MSSDELGGISPEELERRIQELRGRMRPLEAELAELRAQRDVLLTERRRRERLARRLSRADLKQAMAGGSFPNVAELVAAGPGGDLDGYVYNLKTGGEVRLGFPGAPRQSLTFTDGKQLAQAGDLDHAFQLYQAGWELGSPGRPGVRIHFPGTRQEKLVDAQDVFGRPRDDSVTESSVIA